MTGRRTAIACCLAGVLATVGTAHAQTPTTTRRPVPHKQGEPRVTLTFSGGVESTAGSVADHIAIDRNVETETIDVKYPSTPGLLIDVGGRARVWKRLGFGVAVSHVTGSGTADITASVPHPFFFNQPRTVTGQADLSREETGIHVQVQYSIRASKNVQVVLGAGPSRIKLTQDVVTEVSVNETYPYDTATFRDAVTKGASTSVTGFNAGVDVTWSLTRNVGFGGLFRYARADADLDVRTDHTLTMKAGGVHAAAGVRFAF
jgi:hypothetical protein